MQKEKDKKHPPEFLITLLESIIQPIKFYQKKKNGIIYKISPDIPNGIYDLSNLGRYGYFMYDILEFKQIMDSKLSKYNNSAFYNNIPLLKIYSSEQLSEEAVEGSYNHKKIIGLKKRPKEENRIYSKHYLFHELLHLATSYSNDKGYVTSGFKQTLGNYVIGRGINEGYTELMTRRYFSECEVDKGDENVYPVEQVMVYGIEMLIGREKMEELFFNADLYGLYAEMQKYMSKKNVQNIIELADQTIESTDTDLVKKIYYTVKESLTEINLQKLNFQRENGEISEEEYHLRRLQIVFYGYAHRIEKLDGEYYIGWIDQPFTNKLTEEQLIEFENYFEQEEVIGEELKKKVSTDVFKEKIKNESRECNDSPKSQK